MDDRDNIARRLRQARAARSYRTGTDAAKAMGVPVPTYLGHENAKGTTGLKRDVAVRYARFFRINLTWLLTGKGDMEGGSGAPVQDIYDELSPEAQRQVIDFIEFHRLRGGKTI